MQNNGRKARGATAKRAIVLHVLCVVIRGGLILGAATKPAQVIETGGRAGAVSVATGLGLGAYLGARNNSTERIIQSMVSGIPLVLGQNTRL